jgi:DNA recombination protein RmuC
MPDVLVLLIASGALVAAVVAAARASAAERSVERAERALRDELARQLSGSAESLGKRIAELGGLHAERLERFDRSVEALTASSERRLDGLRDAIDGKLEQIQEDNAKRLEEMRATVDEKLQGALEQRLGESFRLVSERLEQVHNGLGEMRNLAAGVGDLKRVLVNVKARGTWGEVQLGSLLEQVLAPGQYEANVETRPGSGDRVEFAVKLPGREGDGDSPVWLPIDAKFPLEDYQRLVEAADRGDAAEVEAASKALEARVRAEAQKVQAKYVELPHTTDFAILFLPMEGLYAEVLRRPGLADALQRELRVAIAGPTTLWAFLASLQMGFRTVAIERRSSEVWRVLGAVKAEFGKFGGLLEGVQKKLVEASNKMDDVTKRTRAIDRRLRDVEELPPGEAPDG